MYRERIVQFYPLGQGVLVIPKNPGLKGYAWKVLKEAGLEPSKWDKTVDTIVQDNWLTVLLRRGEDIPQVVLDENEMGRIAIGLTGDDLFDEYRMRKSKHGLRVLNTYDWFDPEARFLRPALCLINKSGNVNDLPLEVKVALNGKYEITGRNYLANDTKMEGKSFIVTTFEGNLEDALARGSYDCCIDTIYSGRSIDKRELKVADIIRFSDLVLITAETQKWVRELETYSGNSWIPRERTFKVKKFPKWSK